MPHSDKPVPITGSNNSAEDFNHEKSDLTARPAEFNAVESPENAEDVEMDVKEKNRILRKIDKAIVPYSALLYLLSFLDRVNIGQARVAGMNTELGLSNKDFQIALTVFFVSYVAVEVPSNLALKILSPSRWITINMVLWSICCIGLGLVNTAGQLIAIRFLLGLFEGVLFPGLNFVFSLYYTREELGTRTAIFFAGATLAGAFGGLLAYGIRFISVGSYNGWRWIFIIEGLLTLVCAIPAWWLIQDFPAKAKVLNQGNDRKKWLHHLHQSQGVTSAELPFSWEHVKRGLANWRTWVYATMYLSIAQPFYSLSLFLPSIIAALGFKGPQANALSTPPYVLGFITTLGLCWLSDRMKRRGIFIIGVMSLTIVGYIILIVQNKAGVSYFACFLTVAGVSPGIALAITWVGSNFGPITTRATVMGVFFSAGNSAGLISSNVYPANTAPRYFQGHGIALGTAFLAICCAALLMWDHGRENARRDALYGPIVPGQNPLHAPPEQIKRWGLDNMTREQVLDLGDKHPGYRYLL